MERKQLLKGVFMTYQRCGYIGTGDKVPVINQVRQQPLLTPDVEKVIREQKEKEEIKKNPPEHKRQEPLYPPFINPNKK